MKNIFYEMKKTAWDCRTGGYDAIERWVGPLTIEQVRTRVKRLPDSTIHFWNITMSEQDEESSGGSSIVGNISAEEFDGEVPYFGDES